LHQSTKKKTKLPLETGEIYEDATNVLIQRSEKKSLSRYGTKVITTNRENIKIHQMCSFKYL
jgi:carbamoylphosphate synthase large subunit